MLGVPASVRTEITMAGGIVVAPQGNVGGADRTDIAPPTGAWYVQDLEVADQIVACAVKNHNIDPDRITSTGSCSAGGLMSGTFGLMRSQYVAAVAPNSGGINYMASRKLSDTTHGPASFCMHGGAGDNVIVNFSDTSTWFEAQNRMAANHPFMIDWQPRHRPLRCAELAARAGLGVHEGPPVQRRRVTVGDDDAGGPARLLRGHHDHARDAVNEDRSRS